MCADGLDIAQLEGKAAATAAHSMLGQVLRVHTTDDRVVFGTFKVGTAYAFLTNIVQSTFLQCLDGLGNLVLANTEVWRTDEGSYHDTNLLRSRSALHSLSTHTHAHSLLFRNGT